MTAVAAGNSIRPPSAAPRLLSGRGVLFVLVIVVTFCAITMGAGPVPALFAVTCLLIIALAPLDYRLLLPATFAVIPFQQSLTGESVLNVSSADCLSALLLPFLILPLLRTGRLRLGPAGLPLVTFLLVETISSLAFWEGHDTAVSLLRTGLMTLGGLIIFANLEWRPRAFRRCFQCYLVAVTVLGLFTLMTFAREGISHSMYTLAMHKNALGPTFGVGVVTALALLVGGDPLRAERACLTVVLAVCAAGLLLSLSRGAWLATASGGVALLVLTRRFRIFVLTVVMLTVTGAVLWKALPRESVEYATDVSGDAGTIRSRLVSIQAVMAEYASSPVFGVGIGLRKRLEPHNVFVLTLGETGLIGLGAFVAMFVAAFWTFWLAWREADMSREARTVILVGAAIVTVTLVHGTMDVYWRRGVGLAGWAAVGMATAILGRCRDARRTQDFPA